MPAAPADLVDRLSDILADHRGMEGALLPILHAVQANWGYIPAEAQPIIAHDLNISRAEVHGVITFYHDFRAAPAGAHVVKLCRAEACQAMGADRVASHAQQMLCVDWHGTSASGITLEPVFCLGLCACAPAALVDGRVVGRVDEARFDALVTEVTA